HFSLLYAAVSFFWPRRPPSPPLFPYTTLFRSGHAGDRPALARLQHARIARPAAHGWQRAGTLGRGGRRALAGRARHRGADSGGEDRKSTRLNSSHDQISYAVFCLKKKKQSKNI